MMHNQNQDVNIPPSQEESSGFLWWREWSKWPPKFPSLIKTISPKKTMGWAVKPGFGLALSILIGLGLAAYIIFFIATGGLALIPLIFAGIGIAIAGLITSPLIGLLIGAVSTLFNGSAFLIANAFKYTVYAVGFTITNAIRLPFRAAGRIADAIYLLATGKSPTEDYQQQSRQVQVPRRKQGFLWYKDWAAWPPRYDLFRPWSFKDSFLWALRPGQGDSRNWGRVVTGFVTLGLIAAGLAFVFFTGGLGLIPLLIVGAAALLLSPILGVAVGTILGAVTTALNLAITAITNIIKPVVWAIGFAVTNLFRAFRGIFTGEWPWKNNHYELDGIIHISQHNQSQHNQSQHNQSQHNQSQHNQSQHNQSQRNQNSNQHQNRKRQPQSNRSRKGLLLNEYKFNGYKNELNTPGISETGRNLVYSHLIELYKTEVSQNGMNSPLADDIRNYNSAFKTYLDKSTPLDKVSGNDFVKKQNSLANPKQQQLKVIEHNKQLINDYIQAIDCQAGINGAQATKVYKQIQTQHRQYPQSGLMEYVNKFRNQQNPISYIKWQKLSGDDYAKIQPKQKPPQQQMPMNPHSYSNNMNMGYPPQYNPNMQQQQQYIQQPQQMMYNPNMQQQQQYIQQPQQMMYNPNNNNGGIQQQPLNNQQVVSDFWDGMIPPPQQIWDSNNGSLSPQLMVNNQNNNSGGYHKPPANHQWGNSNNFNNNGFNPYQQQQQQQQQQYQQQYNNNYKQ